MAKCPKCGADMVNDGDYLKCPNCNSTQIKESANAGQAKNGDAQQSELDLLKARLAELEKKQEKNDKVKTGSLSVKEKLATVAVFFKKWGLKAVLPAALFLIAFITLLVCFCGLRGIYVNVDNPNEFYSFSPTSYEYHGTTLTGDEYVDEGTWKTGGGMLSLTYEDEMFGKITESCPFSHMSYDTIFITDALGDKKEFRRVSVLAYSTPQKTEYTLNLNGGSGRGAGENKLSVGSKIKEPSEPTRRGYQFMGWYTTPDGWKTEGASQFNFNSRIWEDTTVYANWKDLTEYKLTGDMLPKEGVTFFEGDDLTQIYQSAGGVNAKIGNGSVVLEFKDKNGKIVSGTAPRSNVTAKLKEVVIGNNVSSIPDNAFKGCTSLTSVPIPASVTSIGSSAFSGCTSLTSVTIPNSVTSIGDYAFEDCDSLSSVTIPNSVTSIGEYAFAGCNSLKSVNIPYSVSYIGNMAFFNSQNTTTVYIAFPSTPSAWASSWYGSGIKIVYDKTVTSGSDENYNYYILDAGIHLAEYIGSNTVVEIPEYIDGKKVVGLGSIFESNTTVTSVTISDGIKAIPYRMFYGCTSLTSVTIPDSVTSIGDYAFYGCTSLTSVTIGNSVTSIGEYAFAYSSSLTSVTIPDSVTSIGSNAFNGCTFEINWGNNPTIETISSYAFSGYKGTSITIPDSVTSIGEDAFYGCTGLTEINWNAVSVKDFTESSNVFYNAGKEENGITVTFGDSVQKIPAYAFYECTSLTSVTIPDSVTSIGDFAFYDCTSLTSVIIGDGVTSIGYGAFSDCTSLTSVTIPDSVTSIGSYTFYNCTSLTSVTIGDGVKSIGEGAFSGCTSLTSVTIPDSVTSIGEKAFYDCTSLTSVTIGNGVTSIGDGAFSGCDSLTSVTIPDSVTSIGNNAFYGCTGLTEINWNAVSVKDFTESSNVFYNAGKEENGITVTFGDSVQKIPAYAFYNCTSLTSVTIGNGVTSIGGSAFSGCASLTSVTIPDSVTSIGSSAFYNTPYYNNLPNGEVYLGKVLYKYKGNMPSNYSVIIKEGTVSISDYAFSNCTSLTSVTIPDSVTSIGEYAFFSCDSLTSVTIGNSVTSIGDYAFCNCTSLTSVTIGNSVTSIGYDAFSDCTSLTSVTIPDSVTSIDIYAFYRCTSLTSVTFEGTVAQWNAISKGSYWNVYSPFTKVVCSDGTVSV